VLEEDQAKGCVLEVRWLQLVGGLEEVGFDLPPGNALSLI